MGDNQMRRLYFTLSALVLLNLGSFQTSLAAQTLPPLYFVSGDTLWSWSAERGIKEVDRSLTWSHHEGQTKI